MKTILESLNTFIVAVIGLIGGFFWYYNSPDYEPLILCIVSTFQILFFLGTKMFYRKETLSDNSKLNPTGKSQIINNNDKIKNQINIHKNQGDVNIK